MNTHLLLGLLIIFNSHHKMSTSMSKMRNMISYYLSLFVQILLVAFIIFYASLSSSWIFFPIGFLTVSYLFKTFQRLMLSRTVFLTHGTKYIYLCYLPAPHMYFSFCIFFCFMYFLPVFPFILIFHSLLLGTYLILV